MFGLPDPAVLRVAGLRRALVFLFESGEFIRFDCFARGFDIDAEKLRRVQAKDFVFNRVRELRVMILLDQFVSE